MKMKKLCSWIMLQILLLSMLMLAFNIHSARSTENTWWDSAWIYRRQINITENSGYSLLDFPVEVTFEHDGKVQADGRDMRIIENSTEIPYCITSINSSWVTVMFEANLTSLSIKNVSIYYGNANATIPNYPLVPLTINEGQQKGNATIDDRIFIGWDYVAWGVQPGWYIVGGNLVYIDNNPVVLWTDFRLDFDSDGLFEENEDLITDIQSWKGGIGRYHLGLGNFVERSFGLGDYKKYVQTPVYVDIVFADAVLRVFRKHDFIQTTQADRLQIYGTLWDYAKHQNGTEENIIDGLNTNGPSWDPLWHVLYNSSMNPGWMAYRNSLNGYIFGAIGFNINSTYIYYFPAKETHAWERSIFFDHTTEQSLSPHDQPLECKIYWYADGSNGYSEIDKTATTLSNPPLVSVLPEEIIPEFPSVTILLIAIVVTTTLVIIGKRKLGLRQKT